MGVVLVGAEFDAGCFSYGDDVLEEAGDAVPHLVDGDGAGFVFGSVFDQLVVEDLEAGVPPASAALVGAPVAPDAGDAEVV